jgi:hypothetical protein
MDLEKDALNYLLEQLKEKASIKQLVYRNLQGVFNQMRTEGSRIISDLEERIKEIDTSVIIAYQQTGDFEFRLKFGGDTLVFYMQSNIITFKEDFPLMQSPYIGDDPSRKYFGHITIYNFLSDSIKYNRLDDPGYLIARMLLNKENHFFVEGAGQLNFLFQDLENNKITGDWLRLIIEKAMAESMDHDLIGPNYPDIHSITLKQKLEEQMASVRGQKIGFQMWSDGDIEG